ncbi:hypothetical protein CLHOM_32950 [Clostridium homopropionicum DSM 5847]|uniref:DUF975 family protein n=1 Tax=Clostridium homopropionicum DSM 5847 TaxID=1121318 RepID=A0A0L6Z6F6_9CLOT|nr:DUF975 family protein [Clostridium homopropionicum]KOA18393.1 hypothetical protein CLHOM_32950 [Clostridium homopropionicum DSM 5847]SFF67735.1 Uncharacterized membrane protein [Clostridium homopropionicum]
MNEDIRIKSIGELKRGAKEKLKGNWGIAILLTFLATLITNAFSFSGEISNLIDIISRGLDSLNTSIEQISEGTLAVTILVRLGMIINLLIGGSISYGISKFFLNLIRKEKLKVETLFSGFKYFGKNFLIQLIVGIFSFLWSLVIWIPAIILIIIIIISQASTLDIFYDPNISFSLIAGLLAIIIIAAILCSTISYLLIARYAMTYYIFVDNPDFAVMECISASKEIMEGNKVRLLLLQISFIGWHILSIITLFIGYLWIIPYINSSIAEFYNNLKEISEPKAENIIEDKIEITLEKNQDEQ